MIDRLTTPQRIALIMLASGHSPCGTSAKTARALAARGLISDGWQIVGCNSVLIARVTDAGRARLGVKRGRKPGAMTIAHRAFQARQMSLFGEGGSYAR